MAGAACAAKSLCEGSVPAAAATAAVARKLLLEMVGIGFLLGLGGGAGLILYAGWHGIFHAEFGAGFAHRVGEWGEVTESDAVATCLAVFEHGMNLIDTAPIYGYGRAEEIIGKAMRQHGRR